MIDAHEAAKLSRDFKEAKLRDFKILWRDKLEATASERIRNAASKGERFCVVLDFSASGETKEFAALYLQSLGFDASPCTNGVSVRW